MKQTSGEKMMEWVMRHVLPWFLLVAFVFCTVMVFLGLGFGFGWI